MSTTREDKELERELAELEREDQHEYYTLLNVDLKATQEEIRSAYRRLCRVYHPDRYGHKCEVPVRYLNPLSFPPPSLPYSLSLSLSLAHAGTRSRTSSRVPASSSTASRRPTGC